MNENLIIKNARVITHDSDEIKTIYISNGVFAKKCTNATVIDAKGLILAPGFVDIHAHLREPGQTSKETIKSASLAAAAGGFTSVLAMPNTNPPADNTATIQLIDNIIKSNSLIRIYQSGCITENREGKKLAPIGSLKNAGVVAITDDGACVQNNELMRRALEYSNMFDLLLMDHCQDESLSAKGQIHEGEWSCKLGLAGWPSAAEDIIVSRDIILSHYTNAKVHLQHISSEYSIDTIRRAKARGIKVSSEATPHHIALTDKEVEAFNTNAKMNPPLRSEKDRKAIIKGLCDGTIDCIATDHAPHSENDKDKEFDYAPFGIIGFETAFSVCYEALVLTKKLSLQKLIQLMTINPAKLININAGTLDIGKNADFVLIDLNADYIYNKTFSRSKNSPWWNKKLKGKIISTFISGNRIYNID